MAFRMPAFMVSHPYGELADISAITDQNAQLTDASKRSIIDFRVGTLAAFTSSLATHAVQMAYPTNTVFVNRLVIPAGHNLSGATVEVFSDTTSPVAETGANSKGSSAVSGAGVFDLPLVSSAERFRRVDFQGTGQWEFGELWLGRYVQLADAAVQREWSNPFIHSLAEIEFPSGVASARLALPRRRFGIAIRNIDPTHADYTILDDVLQNGRHRPFWYWPPDDNDPGPFLVKLTDRTSREQDSRSPQKRIRYRVELEMEEQAL